MMQTAQIVTIVGLIILLILLVIGGLLWWNRCQMFSCQSVEEV